MQDLQVVTSPRKSADGKFYVKLMAFSPENNARYTVAWVYGLTATEAKDSGERVCNALTALLGIKTKALKDQRLQDDLREVLMMAGAVGRETPAMRRLRSLL